MIKHRSFFVLPQVLLLTSMNTIAENRTITVAVASNFHTTLQEIAEQYEAESGHVVRISSASSGKLYAQISNGAPFDVFLSADSERPRRLESEGSAIDGSRFTYAIGKLVLWSRDPALAASDCEDRLKTLEFSRLAIANPVTAPYGTASREVLENLGVWTEARDRLVVGENITQALQFVASGGATFGLIAAAQIMDPRLPATSCLWLVPDDLHRPIEQQAVRLRSRADGAPVAEFIEFLRSEVTRAIILRHGYSLPTTVR